MSEPDLCPICGAAIPGGHPRGLCPRCALSEALHADVNADARGDELAALGDGVGRSFGDYELLEEIARGGMGVVYKARQKSLDRIVAIKMLLLGRHSDKDMIRRFKNEAIITANLRHPNIVTVHEVGMHDGQDFIVMDYVPGSNLARFVGQQPLPAKVAAEFVKTIAEAIHYAHESGILHRDLKPSNVLIDPKNKPHVTDFGLARQLDGESSLTLSGQVLGSLNYMPPEQAAALHQKVNRGSDVYGLGAILYHLLTGRPPFCGATMAETLEQVMKKEAASPRRLNSEVPFDLATICLKCLEKDPPKRYGTAADLADDLDRWLKQEPIWAQPASGWEHMVKWVKRNPVIASLASVAFLLGVLVVAQHLWQGRREDPETGGLLRVGPAAIAVQPQTQTAPPCATITFVVVPAGEGPLKFRWKKDGADLVDDRRVSGAATPKLKIANVQTEDLGSYTLLVSNVHGSATSDAAALLFAPPRFEWVQRAGGAGPEGCGGSMAVDPDGNVLVTGDFFGTAEFGNATVTSSGDQDIWIAKYSSAGALLWVRTAGGPRRDKGEGVTVDRTGYVYVAGKFSSTATFAHTNLTSAGKADIFVAKYSPRGELLWVRQAGGQGEDAAYGITTDNRGGCIITGPFEGAALFDSQELKGGGGTEEFYLAQYDATGTVRWAVQGGGAKNDAGASVAVGPAGDCYVTGWFDATARFGETVLPGTPNDRHLFAAKYSHAGDLIWIRQGRPLHSHTAGHGLTLDYKGNVYVAGISSYRPDPKMTLSVTSFNDAGFQLWQQKMTGLFNDQGCLRIASDEAGNCSVIFGLKGNAMFGSIRVKGTGTDDFYIANYSPQGLLRWIQRSEGPGVGAGRAIAVGHSGQIYVVGYFSGTEQFGPHVLTSHGETDMFLAKLADDNARPAP